MKRKKIIYLFVIVVIVLVSVPVVFIVSTFYNENQTTVVTPKGFTNDASRLNQTKVDSIIDVPQSKIEMIRQLRGILAYARQNKKAVSIAGAKHSMGGHTMYPDGIVLNMRPYKQMHFDKKENILTIGSGALWEDAINYLDKFDKSIIVMQAFSSFSIGGSISVNGHGWQKNSPPVASSVESFTLMKADGQIVNCSRKENAELFHLVIGGYGLFGIILDVRLHVTDNENLTYTQYKLESGDYLRMFRQHASDDANVKMVFGRLNISKKDFIEKATLNVFASSPVALDHTMREPGAKSAEIKRLIFRSSVNSEYGKRLRWDLETHLGKYIVPAYFTRNEVLNDHASLIENKDAASTDILQEYFIPERHLNQYIAAIQKALPDDRIDLLNITIRGVYKDSDSYLNYARENVFGFVFLFNQKKTQPDEIAMQKLTQKLVRIALDNEGTYYLPYRLHIDRATFRKSYPQADAFFELKLKYDPEEIFKNKFYDHYK
jgi:FAD/FMN-containing dehydrogenase